MSDDTPRESALRDQIVMILVRANAFPWPEGTKGWSTAEYKCADAILALLEPSEKVGRLEPAVVEGRTPEDYELLTRLRRAVANDTAGLQWADSYQVRRVSVGLLKEAADALELAWKLLDQRNDEDERRFKPSVRSLDFGEGTAYGYDKGYRDAWHEARGIEVGEEGICAAPDCGFCRASVTPGNMPDTTRVQEDRDFRIALLQMLDYCRHKMGKSHQGYFGPGGWAYETLRPYATRRERDTVSPETREPELQGPVVPFDMLWGAGRTYQPEKSSLDLIREMREGWDETRDSWPLNDDTPDEWTPIESSTEVTVPPEPARVDRGAQTPEQAARDLLERLGVEDAQSWSAGEVVELANIFNELWHLRAATALAGE